jgi:hypothetical protein
MQILQDSEKILLNNWWMDILWMMLLSLLSNNNKAPLPKPYLFTLITNGIGASCSNIIE